MTKESVEKLNQAMYSEVFLPAFVKLYNEKAASVNMPGISNQNELTEALQLSDLLQNQKSASGISANPLTQMHKAAQALTQNVNAAETFAKMAVNSKGVSNVIKAASAK